MPKRKIPLVNQEIYHVFNRSVAKQPIFHNKKENETFLSLLEYYRFPNPPLRFSHYQRLNTQDKTKLLRGLYKKNKHLVEIYSFSIMPNHYHLLLKQSLNSGIMNFIRLIQNSYARFLNLRYKRSGSLFQSPFKAVRLETDEQFIHVARYIHLNPVKAGLCQHPKEHLWTSHLYYLTDCKGYDWLFRDILREYGKTTRVARQNFDLMVRGNLSEEIIQAIEQPKNGIIGGDFFVSWVNENFVESRHKKAKEISRKEKELQSSVTGRDIIENIQHCYDVNLAELRSTIRGQRNEARSLAIYLMRHRLGYSLKTISRWFRVENEYVIAKTLSRFKKDLNEKTCLKRMREIEHAVLRKASP